ncbi:MAG: PLP-dependent aminotransferase family protein [Candidatus Thermoplasmatota archaeon]|nr:PLP-dependent aminotransferase family protein [Candidatus Thermoplasmatota archaeon]MBU1940776.1 PLP-dependent aminotransferase family protein [Candidatus Thermoplasmatota archaeon]
MISFAGGLPNPNAFPVEIIHECIEKVFKTDISNALQYGTTEGLTSLRGVLAQRMRSQKNINCELHNIIMTTGAQQGLSLVALCFIDPGDTYLTSVPTYLGAIQAFNAYEANCESIPMDEEGIDTDSLRRNLERLRRTSILPKFLYAVPNFQNPSGETMPLATRKELLDIASEYDFLIVEDDPYGELVFEGEMIPPIKSFDKRGRVIYLSTFSKILAPGFRLGWVIASKEILDKLILAKQATDLCTNVFSQYVAYEYVNGGYLDRQVTEIKRLYKRKRDIMLDSLKKYFPKSIKWTVPKGGMFIWISLPKSIDTRLMFQKALSKKIAYVVGEAFFPEGGNYNSMRLNFSYSEDDVIPEGIKRLAEVIKEELATSYQQESYVPEGV